AVETTETSTKEPDFQIETVNQQSKSRKCLVKMLPIKINETQPITRYEIDENGKKYYDLLEEKWMSRSKMKEVEGKLRNASKEDISSSWARICPFLDKVKEGKIDSYRHDVFKNLKQHIKDHKLIRPHHIQWERLACLQEDVKDHLCNLVKEAFREDDFQYRLDVLEPVAWKFFVIDFTGIEHDEIEYFIDRFDKDWSDIIHEENELDNNRGKTANEENSSDQ
uniref:Uncharacterized protein n=1 Tax=Clytia hemisphaerica TaxID=252671 RepID=A0A7M5X9A0_9CNID